MNDIPQGFRFAGLYSGVKRDASKLDLSLIVSDRPAVAAGVYTRNLVFAAPVGSGPLAHAAARRFGRS